MLYPIVYRYLAKLRVPVGLLQKDNLTLCIPIFSQHFPSFVVVQSCGYQKQEMRAFPPYSWNLYSCEISGTAKSIEEQNPIIASQSYSQFNIKPSNNDSLYLFDSISVVDTSESIMKCRLDSFIRRITQYSGCILKVDNQFIDHLVLHQ